MSEFDTICKIADRAEALYEKHGLIMPTSRSGLILDIEHTNRVNPIDLEAWLAGDDGNFSHDLGGIIQHFDREALRLTEGWTPRYSRGSISFDDLIGFVGAIITLLVFIAVLGLFEGPLS